MNVAPTPEFTEAWALTEQSGRDCQRRNALAARTPEYSVRCGIAEEQAKRHSAPHRHWFELRERPWLSQPRPSSPIPVFQSAPHRHSDCTCCRPHTAETYPNKFL